MAEDLILNNFRTAYQILSRNVLRTLRLHVGSEVHITCQVEEVMQFFAEAEQNAGVFPAPEYEALRGSITNMFKYLEDARPQLAQDPQAADAASVPPSEMHRALRIPEIVWMIASHLDGKAYWSGESAALAALARTSKSFHGPALDALWWHQGTLRNLVDCMPADLWELETIDRMSTLRLRRQIQPADWDRALQYSVRIRSLSVSTSPRYLDRRWECLSQVFRVIHLGVPRDYLMPNLEALSWHPGPRIEFAHIQSFLGPRIKSIHLPSLNSPGQLSVLSTLTRNYTRLTEVTIDRFYHLVNGQMQIQRPISVFVHALQCVRSLSVGCLDLAAIGSIGQLPTLESLTLALSAEVSLSGLSGQGLFRNLRQLSLLGDRGGEIEAATAFVRTCGNPKLVRFEAHFSRSPTAEATEIFYQTLVDHCSHDALETLEVDPHGFPEAAVETCIVRAHTLKPLYCFTRLIVVSILAPVGYQQDDTTIAELAAAWPQIEELRLKAGEHKHQCGTLLALRAFAQHCPNLHTLEISFDACSVPPPHPDPYLRQHLLHPALVSLDVAKSPISDAFDVAPGEADEEELANPEIVAEIHHDTLWKEVEKLLPKLNDIRAEEFNWGVQSIDHNRLACVLIWEYSFRPTQAVAKREEANKATADAVQDDQKKLQTVCYPCIHLPDFLQSQGAFGVPLVGTASTAVRITVSNDSGCYHIATSLDPSPAVMMAGTVPRRTT
ncbi:hypothetical protein MVEN_01974300 [Mycena venus]|uniref:F-box domain-containing protein n=1 Tax=Mycena venus TaxID=2733690 RepID=A0A8H7CJY2_9AGAR|nr:hypothetical protein MVEN_01974300 [Mycena venus]